MNESILWFGWFVLALVSIYQTRNLELLKLRTNCNLLVSVEENMNMNKEVEEESEPEDREWVYESQRNDKDQTRRRQERPSPAVHAWGLGRVWSRGSKLGFRRRPKKQGCFRPWDHPSNCLRRTSCCQTFFSSYSPFYFITPTKSLSDYRFLRVTPWTA